MARPLVSVSPVRVSLTVRTKQPDGRGSAGLVFLVAHIRDYRRATRSPAVPECYTVANSRSRRFTRSPTSRTSIVFRQRLSLQAVSRWL